MSSKLDGPGIAAISVGIIFAYAGIKGYSPLTAIANIIKGKHPNEGQSAASLTNPDISDTFGGGTFSGTVSASGNQKIAQELAIQMGHGDWTTGKQWSDWVALWNGESGWSETAYNQSSGATGIPQALPGSKMASAGPDWKTNPRTQIKWGIGYIAGRYGSPSAAYAAWLSRSPHWY
jgi:hypothetical protein